MSPNSTLRPQVECTNALYYMIWPVTVLSTVPSVFHAGPGTSGSAFCHPCKLTVCATSIFFSHSLFPPSFLPHSSICFNKCGPFIWISKLTSARNPEPFTVCVCVSVYTWVRLQVCVWGGMCAQWTTDYDANWCFTSAFWMRYSEVYACNCYIMATSFFYCKN